MIMLDKIREQLDLENLKGTINVHAHPVTIHEIINGITRNYNFIDWTTAIQTNRFEFALDGITLSFVHNRYVPKDHYRLINDDIYRATNFGPIHMSRVIQEVVITPRDGATVKDHINFCIGKGLKFVIVAQPNYKDSPPVFEIWSPQPYRFFFERFGFTDEAYSKCKEVVMEKIEHTITIKSLNFTPWARTN